MGRLQTCGESARRSPVFWVVAGVVLAGLIAGGVVLASGSRRPSAPSVSTSTRAVALGDSVPYGHGLANPYRTPQVGLPAGAVSQGPAMLAYPSEVARDLGLTMTVRKTNCDLTGDQLAISGAVADPADDTVRDTQCLHPPQQARNLGDEMAAADLTGHPARLVLLQAGADDIDFGSCLEYELARALGIGFGIGTSCVENGAVTAEVATRLSNVRTSLAHAIESMAPHARTIAVLDYFQPVPPPSEIADDTAASGLSTNLVCTGLKANAAAAYAAAQVVASALNKAIAGAVTDARAHHVTNATLVDISASLTGHGMCTADPWVFSGELVPDTTLAADLEHLVAAKTCDGTTALHGAMTCASLIASADRAEASLAGYVWRAAHPTAAGQHAIASVVESQLRGRV
jgi:hypothetical protein